MIMGEKGKNHVVILITLPETNSEFTLKIDAWKTT